MIKIITEKVEMPALDERKYRKFRNRNGLDIWYVFDTETKQEVYSGSYKNASLACHNLNKKYYKELCNGKYQGDREIGESRIYEEFENV